MKKIILLFLLFPITIEAQTLKFQWTQDNSDAQVYQYQLELDNLLQRVNLVATCVGIQTFTCTAPVPNILPTNHKVRIRAVDVSETKPKYSDWSDSLTFNLKNPPKPNPNKPGGLTIIVEN